MLINENNETNCRICYYSFSTINNHLLKLCNCNEFSHFKSFRTLMKLRTKIIENKSKNITSYIWNHFFVIYEKKTYPSKFKYKEIIQIYFNI